MRRERTLTSALSLNNNANAIQLDAGNDRLNIDAEVYHDSDSGNQRFYITRSGATDQSGSIYTDDKTFVFDSTQDGIYRRCWPIFIPQYKRLGL